MKGWSCRATKIIVAIARFRLLFLMVLIHLLILIHGSMTRFPNVDELGHLPAAVSHWAFSKFDLYRVSPPLIPLVAGFLPSLSGIEFDWRLYSDHVGVRPEFAIGVEYLDRAKLGALHDYIAARLCCTLFSVVGVVVLTAWAYEAMGLVSAHVVCAFWCFCPNILAFAPTLIPDVGSVSMGIMACYFFWKYAKCPSLRRAAFAGFCLGLALLAKLTWITAIVTLPVTAAMCIVFLGGPWSIQLLRKRASDLAVSVVAAFLVLNVGYLCEGSFQRLRDYEFCSEMLGGSLRDGQKQGNRFAQTWIGKLPVPLPRNYVLGIDYLKHEVEEEKFSFLMGETKLGSWPHYYIMTTIFKTPETTLLASAVGLAVLSIGISRRMASQHEIMTFMFLGVPASICFASVSFQGGFNHHHRYVLMIYPLLFMLAGYVASPAATAILKARITFVKSGEWSFAVPFAIMLVTLSALSSLRVHPFYTSYFNTASGGPQNGWRLLGFSNIDWGQDLLEVEKWIKENPQSRPLSFELSYFGMNGELFGLPQAYPPLLPKDASVDTVRPSQTQWWIVSVKHLCNTPGHEGMEYLQQLEPVDRIAYAYHVYRIDPLPVDKPELNQGASP